MPVSSRDQAQAVAGSRTPLGAQWVRVLTHTGTAEQVKLKLLMITTMTFKHFIYSHYLPPEHAHVPRSSFFHLSMEIKTAPCTDIMQALDLGS